MALIVDAYNVLHCTHVLPQRWAEIGVQELCRMIERAGVRRGKAVVVCDGAPPPLQDARQVFGDVELLYAGGGRDADSLIEKLIERETAPGNLFVISNDNRLRSAARRRGATSVGSEEFLRRLSAALRAAHTSQAGPKLPADTEYWLKVFETDPEPSEPDHIENLTDYWMRQFGFKDDEK